MFVYFRILINDKFLNIGLKIEQQNSVLKGNVSHNNVLNMSQCGQCIKCHPKNVPYKVFGL